MIFRSNLLILFVTTLLISVSCKKSETFNEFNRGDIASFDDLGTLNRDEIVKNIDLYDASMISQYDVSYYSIDYYTEYTGDIIKTRGLLFLPQGVDTAILVNYTHGTLFPLDIDIVNNNLPSNYRGQSTDFNDVRNFALAMASNGYAVFLPDYVGFTNSSDKEHPYIYYPELFNSIIDGIRAAKQFINDNDIPHDNRVFLAGWSQGAGAAISAHKFLEESFSHEFNVVASSGLAGPYNFEKFMNFVFENKTQEFEYLNIYSWGVYTLNKFSTLKRPTDQLFSYPVYDQMSAIAVPSKIPEEILNNFFIEQITNGIDTQMNSLIQQNSFHKDWTASGKIFLHHGDADDIVPYFNSVDAFEGLTASGSDVVLYSYPDGKHDTELGNFATKTINDFNSLK